MLLLPVIERFAEHGWQPFVHPAETFEFFTASGIFKRARINTHLDDNRMSSQILQRNALLDVCVRSGLAQLIVAYVHAFESPSLSKSRDGVGGQHYVLKEPIALQQWLRRHVETLERAVHRDVASYDQQWHNGTNEHMQRTTFTAVHDDLDGRLRELCGLRAIALALMERLKLGSCHFSGNKHRMLVMDDGLRQTELTRLMHEGVQILLELVYRIQASIITCQCLQWLGNHQFVVNTESYSEFYYTARAARSSLRNRFESSYDVSMASISNSDIANPSLLIEVVMERAGVLNQLSLPPSNLSTLLSILHTTNIKKEVLNFFGDDAGIEPIESYFRVQSALLLYFILDIAYLSHSNQHRDLRWQGKTLVQHMMNVAESFAAQTGVRDDMKATLVSLWLIEHAVNVPVESSQDIAWIYHGAITRLLESSAMHMQKQAGLESNVILYIVETLVHRGEPSFAWKLWTAFDLHLNKLPAIATEYAIVVHLELSTWERALSLLREQRRQSDLLQLVLKWLLLNHRMKELVQTTSLDSNEEILFDQYMMCDRVASENVLEDDSIRKADLLVMYYVLRDRFETAWAVHHEHLALIRESTGGDAHVSQVILNQPSFRIRAALLRNMMTEPKIKVKYTFNRLISRSERRSENPSAAEMMMLESDMLMEMQSTIEMDTSDMDNTMEEDGTMPPSNGKVVRTKVTQHVAQPTATHALFDYSPGFYSSRFSQTRVACSEREMIDDGSFVTTPEGSTRNHIIQIGSIDSTPDSSTRTSSAPFCRVDSSKQVAQTLHFGVSPIAPTTVPNSSARHNIDIPSGSTMADNDYYDDRKESTNSPLRARFNNSLVSFQQPTTKAQEVDDDLSLRSQLENTPVDDLLSSGDRPDTDNEVPTSADARSNDTPVYETPKRFHIIRDAPQTDSVVNAKREQVISLASQELEGMELEMIDEEFRTPQGRNRNSSRRKEALTTPVRRNPRRVSRTKY